MKFEARGNYLRLPVEVRAADDGVEVEGYAAVFRQEADIGGLFRERIERGAFKESIGRDDVVFLIDHDGLPLARTRSGTLELSEDDHGLKMRSVLDAADPDVARITGKMKRGDLDKMSFAFWPDVEEWDETEDIPLRTIKKARLHDVSIVTTPAYDGTEIGIRCADVLEKYRQSVRAQNFAAVRERQRRKQYLELKVRENG